MEVCSILRPRENVARKWVSFLRLEFEDDFLWDTLADGQNEYDTLFCRRFFRYGEVEKSITDQGAYNRIGRMGFVAEIHGSQFSFIFNAIDTIPSSGIYNNSGTSQRTAGWIISGRVIIRWILPAVPGIIGIVRRKGYAPDSNHRFFWLFISINGVVS